MITKSQKKVGAVITGGGFLMLGVLRTLGRKGIPLILLNNESSIGNCSRFNIKLIKSPRPSDIEDYADFLIRLAERERIPGWIIFPHNDEVVYVLSRHRDILENYFRIPTPSWDVIRNVYIKKNTYIVAEKNGILIPKIYDVNNFEQLMDADLQYPLVLKPSISHRFLRKIKIKAFRINNKEELIKTYLQMSDVIDSSEIIVQDFIPGGPKNLYSFCPFFKNGKVITGIAARRPRQRPMDFGYASTYVELVDIPELRSISEKFLGLINYYGIAEVEFMYDPRDRQYKLLEVNPRIWVWHALAIAACVDLPYILYQDMIGEEIAVPDYIKQVKWIRLITDIPTVFSEIAKGNLKLSDYATSMKGKKVEAVLSFTDPLPFFAEIALILYRRLKRYISHNV